MFASVGDWVVIRPEHLNGQVREGLVVHSQPDGSPPWRVRWTENDKETLVFPGPDTHVLHHAPHEPGLAS
jgi:hypothetical protein